MVFSANTIGWLQLLNNNELTEDITRRHVHTLPLTRDIFRRDRRHAPPAPRPLGTPQGREGGWGPEGGGADGTSYDGQIRKNMVVVVDAFFCEWFTRIDRQIEIKKRKRHLFNIIRRGGASSIVLTTAVEL